MRRKSVFVCVLVVAVLALWLGNTTVLVDVPEDRTPRLIAHRGMHQVHDGRDRSAETCRAAHIGKIDHPFIENTQASIVAALDAGADVVEIDVHLTRDGVLAVFHDWTLDCQTDGNGVTRKQTWADLARLDVGYGFTDDGGQRFPLRGKGVGLMPRLDEMLADAAGGSLLINFKGQDATEGDIVAALARTSPGGARIWGVYGGGPPTNRARAAGLSGFDRTGLKSCLLRYIAVGWSGYVPEVCRDRLVAVPMNFGPLLWGWPHRFTDRMAAAGTRVILWGPYDGSGFSSGIDDLETLGRVPDAFDGWIWTNRIERIGPALAGPGG